MPKMPEFEKIFWIFEDFLKKGGKKRKKRPGLLSEQGQQTGALGELFRIGSKKGNGVGFCVLKLNYASKMKQFKLLGKGNFFQWMF